MQLFLLQKRNNDERRKDEHGICWSMLESYEILLEFHGIFCRCTKKVLKEKLRLFLLQ